MVRGGGQGAVLSPTPYNDSLEIIIKAYYQYSHSSRRRLLHRVDAEADREEARGGDSSSPLVPPQLPIGGLEVRDVRRRTTISFL